MLSHCHTPEKSLLNKIITCDSIALGCCHNAVTPRGFDPNPRKMLVNSYAFLFKVQNA